MDAPSFAISFITDANSSGFTRKEVCPFTTTGSPALGFTTIGREVISRSFGRNFFITSGPKPQFRPMASTLSPSNRATAASISPPVSSFPFSSNTMVTITGRLVCSFAASTAALISYVSFIVSIRHRSAPACSPAMHTGTNALQASSKGRSPRGSSNFPKEPISRATNASFPVSAIARLAS